jgi:hypothetical protein
VGTNKSALKGHHPQSLTLSTHGHNQTLTKRELLELRIQGEKDSRVTTLLGALHTNNKLTQTVVEMKDSVKQLEESSKGLGFFSRIGADKNVFMVPHHGGEQDAIQGELEGFYGPAATSEPKKKKPGFKI